MIGKLKTTPIERDELKLRALDALVGNGERNGMSDAAMIYRYERAKLVDDVLRRLADLPAGESR